MAHIHSLEIIYYCPLKKNRLVDDTGGVSKYKPLEKLEWTSQEFKSGKLIKIRNFPAQKKVKLFRVTVSTNRTEYVVTNDLTQKDTTEVKKVCS
jgi:hypothetical protein